MPGRFITAIALVASTCAFAAALPIADALQQKRAGLHASGNGRETISVKLSPAADGETPIVIPAGSKFVAADGSAQVTLTKVEAKVAPGAETEAIIPAAALSSANVRAQRELTLATKAEPALTPLIELFAHQPELPRPTAQLAVFILLEDISWPKWKQWLAPAWAAESPPKPHPTPAEIAQAVDAIAFARLAAPQKEFSILADDELKRLALRNPWARGKAMALYGLTVEDAVTGDPSLPPDLGKLLHTSPNDNCPICRQRTKAPAEIP